MFPTEFAALIAWQHQILFRKTHVDGTLAQHCHSSDKTRRMPRMSWCCAAVLKGAKAAGTKPFSRLHWRLESTRDLGMGLLPSGAWQIAGASPTALNSIVDIAYVAEIYTFLLVKLILRCDNNSTSSWRKNCTDGHNNSDSKPTVKGSAARHFCTNEQQTGFGTSADATLDKDLASCQWRENRSKKTNNILNKDLNIAIPKASKHYRKWKYRNEELQSRYLQSRKPRVLWFSFSVWFQMSKNPVFPARTNPSFCRAWLQHMDHS